MLVAFNEFGSGGDARWAALITAGVMAIQFGAIFSVLRQSMLLFVAVFFAMLAWWTAFDMLSGASQRLNRKLRDIAASIVRDHGGTGDADHDAG